MNFYTYLGLVPDLFAIQYLDTGLVQRQSHASFPLDIYSYGRKAVHDNVWDSVTSKCRGIIVNRETSEIVARPFEKFHNYGSPQATNLYNPVTEQTLARRPLIWEKLDGFMCTLYRWQGVDYIASKGSFHSVHAKWATAWYREYVGTSGNWPQGYTPVFEGLHRDLRIVVDYKDREELVLLALIKNETGAELLPGSLRVWGMDNGISLPTRIDMTLERAREESLKEYSDGLGTDEGYVLTWYDASGQKPPARLKMKFIDYLRLHRMVCGVTPWRIWEALSTENGAVTDWLSKQNSTPWFEKFVQKWIRILNAKFTEHKTEAEAVFARTVADIGVRPAPRDGHGIQNIRKEFALVFMKPENRKYAPVLFKMLDKCDPTPVIWKYVEGVTKGTSPLRDAQFS